MWSNWIVGYSIAASGSTKCWGVRRLSAAMARERQPGCPGTTDPSGVVLRGDAGGNVLGSDLYASPTALHREVPRHGHRAREGGLVEDEVHGLDHTFVGHNLNKASFHDVGARRGLPRRRRAVRVCQDKSIGAARARVEPLEPAGVPATHLPVVAVVWPGRRASWVEAIAQTGFGDEVLRVCRVGLELAAQLGEIDPQVVGLRLVGRSPDVGE